MIPFQADQDHHGKKLHPAREHRLYLRQHVRHLHHGEGRQDRDLPGDHGRPGEDARPERDRVHGDGQQRAGRVGRADAQQRAHSPL